MRCNAEVAMALLQRGADPSKLSSDGKHSLCLLMEGVVQWGLYRGSQGAMEVMQFIFRKGRPSPEVLSAAGAAISNLTSWHSDEVEVVETAQTFFTLLYGEAHADLTGSLGVAMLRAVTNAIEERDPQLDEHRVAHSQTLGTAAVRLPGAVNFALRLGANPNAVDGSGQTATHMLMGYVGLRRVLPDDQAAGEAIADAVRALLRHKADVFLKDKSGVTPVALLQQLEDMGAHYAASWRGVLADSVGAGRKSFQLPVVPNQAPGTPRAPKRPAQVRLPALGPSKGIDPAPCSARELRYLGR